MRKILRGHRPIGILKRCYTDQTLGEVLRRNEVYKKYDRGSAVKELFVNQVGAHNPIQDAWAESSSTVNSDLMYGVFDGNSGIACSHVVSKRIFNYVAVSLLQKEILDQIIKSSKNRFKHMKILSSFQDKFFFLDDYRQKYEDSLNAYIQELLTKGKDREVREALMNSFEKLDEDLAREALEDQNEQRLFTWVGMTGTGATVLHISGTKVTVATAGDALAVVGTTGGKAKIISPEHNVENSEEVSRVLSEHPGEEKVVEKGLLLGSLTAFRSFGNFRYKWSKTQVEKILVPKFGISALAPKSVSPPYITVRPDITSVNLQPDDAFIVIASDGIWDIFPPNKVVEIISNHKPLSWTKRTLTAPWKKIEQLRMILKGEDLKEEIDVEKSPATQLILEALVATTKKLHLPKKYMRNIRDDMTVLVIYLDQEFLREQATPADRLEINVRSEVNRTEGKNSREKKEQFPITTIR